MNILERVRVLNQEEKALHEAKRIKAINRINELRRKIREEQASQDLRNNRSQ